MEVFMHQKIMVSCLILILLITGCAQQPKNNPPVEEPASTELPAMVVSPTEKAVEAEASVYPEPVTEEIVQETTYPAPNIAIVASPYPGADTGISSSSPYPSLDQVTDNNISSPMNPLSGEEKMTKGQVYLDKNEVTVLETDPVQAGLLLVGSLPTPCHYLRVNMTAPDAENKIALEVFSLADPAAVCVQVLQPFETTVNLGSFAAGSYTIWVNGLQVGEYTR